MDAEEKEAQDRLIEATVALLENAPGRRMQITNLNKSLFFLDLAALRDTGTALTRNVYLALKQGPIMHGYKDRLIRDLSSIGLLRQDNTGLGKPVVLKASRQSYRYMDDHMRWIAMRVADTIAGETASHVSKLSHKNPGWRIAWERGAKQGKSPAPINMLIAMQQIAGRDPWLDQPADAELNAVLREAEAGAGFAW